MGETADGELSISSQKAVASCNMIRGDEKPEQLQDKFDWTAINMFEVENENGSLLAFTDVYQDTKTIVIFIRVGVVFVTKYWYGCLGFFCEAAESNLLV